MFVRPKTPHATTIALALAAALTAGATNAPSTPALLMPADWGAADQARIAAGAAELEQRWTVRGSAFGRWGRGPLSNAESCNDCHVGTARGHPPASGVDALSALVLLLSVPGSGPHGEPLPHLAYGDQLQTQGVLGRVPAEGDARIDWRERTVTLADGATVQLRAPTVRWVAQQFGPIGSETRISLRLAPDLHGVGLLEVVTEETLLSLARTQQARGLDGRVNRVWVAAAGQYAIGRFGHKATQPALAQQVAHAFHADLGVTSAAFPHENCPEPQSACRAFAPSPYPEVSEEQIEMLVFYLRALGPPQRHASAGPEVERGRRLFDELGCAECHVDTLRTGSVPEMPQLAFRDVESYSDLLLHDLGEGLADGRPEFEAGARDWRTAPLWALADALRAQGGATLLHDGRARTLEEAILWHGGSAHAAREGFRNLSADERNALLRFLGKL